MVMIRNLNQYLKHRDGRWYYVRRIPRIYENVDKRRTIRKALRTSSLEVARVRRDALAEADEEYWSSLVCLGELNGIDPNSVSAKHRAMARGYIYSPVQQLAETNKLQDWIERIMHVGNQKKDKDQELEAEAILGGAEPPSIKTSEALEIYYEKIAISAVLNKSPHQVKDWRKVKHRAVTNFIKQIGDLPMDEITRADARKFYLWWGERLKPKKDKPGLSGNSANRDLGNLRKIFREYWEYVGEEGRKNPFRNLNSAAIRQAMEDEINAQGCETVSLHCSPPGVRSVVDIADSTVTGLARFRAELGHAAVRVLVENSVTHVEYTIP